MVAIKLRCCEEGSFLLDSDFERIFNRVLKMSGVNFSKATFILGAGVGNVSNADYILLETENTCDEIEANLKTTLPAWSEVVYVKETKEDVEKLFEVKKLTLVFGEEVASAGLEGLVGGDILALEADGDTVELALKGSADSTKACRRVAEAAMQRDYRGTLDVWLTGGGDDVDDEID